MIKKFIYIGAKPDFENKHAGGQSTASSGLIEYAYDKGIQIEIIDSAQESFPAPKLYSRLYRALMRVFLLVKKLSTSKYNGVIIFCSSGFSFYEKAFCSLICRILRTKSLLFIRSGHFVDDVNKSRSRKFLAKIFLRFPNMVGAQGNRWKEELLNLNVHNNKILIIRNWLSLGRLVASRPKSISSKRRVKFLFVGWVVPKKGIYELIKAFSDSELLRQADLVIVGGGVELDRIKSIGISENLNNVRFTGWASPASVDRELKNADVFVLPSYAEGFPNALLEALSQGLPAITTDVGGITDSVKSGINGIIVSVGNVEELKRALEYYVLNPSIIEQHSLASIKVTRELHDRDINCANIFNSF